MIYFNDKIFYHYLENFTKNDFKSDLFKRNFYELIFFEGGDAEISTGKQSFRLSKNTVTLLAPASNKVLMLLSGKPAKLLHVYFDKNVLPSDLADIEELCGKCFSTKNSPAFNLSILTIKTAEKKFNDRQNFLRYLEYTLPPLLLQIKDMQGQAITPSQSNKLLQACLDYIKNNVTEQFSLDKLAKEFFVSKSHLSHLFTQNLGMGIRQYINLQKITYARSLVMSGTGSMNACHICGFENYSTFYRLYKSTFGLTPEKDKEQAELSVNTENLSNGDSQEV